ncbi:MAG: hypothetical protein RIR18_1535 [Pseudomonadota bacterium]
MIPSKIKQISFCIALLGGVAASAANAASLGRIHVKSALGQPLNAELEINNTYAAEIEGMTAKLAPAASFRQAEVPYSAALNSLRFSIERTANPVIRITTDRPVHEPFLDFLVELNWANGKLVREYTFLLAPQDPTKSASPTPSAEIAPTGNESAKSDAAGSQSSSAPPSLSDESSPQQWKVKPGDSLAGIAAKSLPVEVSLERMLVALYKRNQDAFVGQNMNRLKAGAVLTLPDAATAAATSPQEAHNTVIAHAEDWNVYRKKLAAMAKQAPPSTNDSTGNQDSAGTISAIVPEKMPEQDTKDMVKVSGSETTKQGPTEEDLIAREKALAEANDRISQLERNVEELQKLIQAKNESLAALQQLAEANAAKPAVPPAPQEIEPEEDPEPPTLMERVAAVLVKPWVWGSALVALLGTLIFLLVHVLRSRKTEHANEEYLQPVLAPMMAAHEEEEDDPSLNATFDPTASFDFTSVDLDLSDDENNEPISAADELEPEPEVDPDIAVEEATTKLLLANAYVEMGDLYGAQQLLREVLVEGGLSQREQATSILASLGDDVPEPEITAPVKVADERYSAEDFQQLDDLFANGEENLAEPSTSTQESAEDEDEDDGLSFDEEFGEDKVFEEEVSTETEDEAESASTAIFDEDAFPYEEDDEDVATAESEAENASTDEGETAETVAEEFNFDEGVIEEDAESEQSEEPDEADELESIGDLDFESAPLETEEALTPEASAEEGWEAIENLEAPSADEEIPTNPEVDGDDQVATKLDLVQAYIDMGDIEGARDLLGEVLDEGSDTQKAEAHRLMESLTGQ